MANNTTPELVLETENGEYIIIQDEDRLTLVSAVNCMGLTPLNLSSMSNGDLLNLIYSNVDLK
jgi:hypothetical protein